MQFKQGLLQKVCTLIIIMMLELSNIDLMKKPLKSLWWFLEHKKCSSESESEWVRYCDQTVHVAVFHSDSGVDRQVRVMKMIKK